MHDESKIIRMLCFLVSAGVSAYLVTIVSGGLVNKWCLGGIAAVLLGRAVRDAILLLRERKSRARGSDRPDPDCE